MSIQRGTPRTTHQDHTTHTPVMAATCLQGGQAFCQPRISPALLLSHTAGNSRSQHLPIQTATGQGRGACCKPTVMHLQATDQACRDTTGRMVVLATHCPLSHCDVSHRSQPQSPSLQPSAKLRSSCQMDLYKKMFLSFTGEGSSLEEFELSKLDLIAELQSFSK